MLSGNQTAIKQGIKPRQGNQTNIYFRQQGTKPYYNREPNRTNSMKTGNQTPDGHVLSEKSVRVKASNPVALDFPAFLLWHKIRGFFSIEEAAAIQRIVKILPSGSHVAELGTFQGRSCVAIAAALPPGGILFCVDTFEGTIISPGQTRPPRPDVVRTNLACLNENLLRFGVSDRVRVFVSTTHAASGRFAPDSLGLLFIDAGHDYENVRQDLVDWYPKLAPGGFLVCDDYVSEWPGVQRAIDESGLPGDLIAPSLWMHRKPRQSEVDGV